jgi:hypothetical protein
VLLDTLAPGRNIAVSDIKLVALDGFASLARGGLTRKFTDYGNRNWGSNQGSEIKTLQLRPMET